MILGRYPESDQAISAHLSLGTLENLGKALIASDEFRSKFLQSQHLEPKSVVAPVLGRTLS